MPDHYYLLTPSLSSSPLRIHMDMKCWDEDLTIEYSNYKTSWYFCKVVHREPD